MFYNTLKLFTAYNLLDNGLSNVLGLQTLRHGTSPYNYCKIQMEGAQPALGGKGIGSEGDDRCLGEVYVLKDKIDEAWVDQGPIFRGNKGNMFNDWSKERKRYNGESKPYPLTARQMFWIQRDQSLSARPYAVGATIALFKRLPFFRSSLLFNEKHREVGDLALTERAKALSMVIGIEMIGRLTPQVKFHFTDQQIEENVKTGRFRDDPLHTACPVEIRSFTNGLTFFTAFVTNQVIENSHLGVSGSLRQGLNANLPENMKNHPYKVLYGSTCLIGSGLLFQSLYKNAMSYSKSCTPPGSLATRAIRFSKSGAIVSGMFLYNAYS